MKVESLRKFKVEDISKVTVLLNTYLSKFHLSPVYSEEELQHWFLPQVKQHVKVIVRQIFQLLIISNAGVF